MTFAANLAQSASNNQTFRNRIINGAMTIDQRNAGASITANDGTFAVDRFKFAMAQSSKGTGGQNLNSITPPVGFTNYLGFSSSSAYSVGSSETFSIRQIVEGFNIADLGWGTANAQPVTLSFWVRSSLTGTFGGALLNSSQNRSYPFAYTINSADTWEQKSVTIPGDTSGSWLTNSGKGIDMFFSLGTGASYSGTANAWSGSFAVSVTGAVSVVGTSGATFYITGVQLEEGTAASPFENRLYTTELQLCQRYFQKSYNVNVAPATATDVGVVENGIGTSVPTSSTIEASTVFKVTMRASATITVYDRVGNSGKVARVNPGISSTNNQTVSIAFAGENGFGIEGSGVSAATFIYHYQATAEL
jgi:hypothetical protein